MSMKNWQKKSPDSMVRIACLNEVTKEFFKWNQAQ